MAVSSRPSKAVIAVADTVLWYCAIVVVALILLSSAGDDNSPPEELLAGGKNNHLLFDRRPCDEIYVVREGETLHTISDKCGDPFIVEQNPHIHDPDDVFPGLVIKITPSKPRKLTT